MGMLITVDKTSSISWYRYVGIAIVLLGAAVAGITALAIYSAMKGDKALVGYACTLSFGAVLLLAGVLVLCMVTNEPAIHSAAHEAFFGLEEDKQLALENQLKCCGFDDPSESTDPNCKYRTTCLAPLTSGLVSYFHSGISICAITIMVQLIVSFATGSLWMKIATPKLTQEEYNRTLYEQWNIDHSGKNKAKAIKEDIELGLHSPGAERQHRRHSTYGVAHHMEKRANK